jgi:hypothetical protein
MSILLRLPSELRNEVYRHAFSADKPLDLEVNSEDRLYLTLHDEHDTSVGKSIMSISGKPLNIHVILNTDADEFNQLKFVNKQLYSETLGLEMQYNDIQVRRLSDNHEPPASQFLHWYNSLPITQREWLVGATIVLKDQYDVGRQELPSEFISDSAENMAKLAAFCKAHPSIKVRYQLSQWNFARVVDDDGYRHSNPYTKGAIVRAVYHAYHYVQGLRNENIDHVMSPFAAYRPLRSELVLWRTEANISLEQLQAPNLYYMPLEVEDKSAVMECVKSVYGGSRSDVVKVIEQWIDQGLWVYRDAIR